MELEQQVQLMERQQRELVVVEVVVKTLHLVELLVRPPAQEHLAALGLSPAQVRSGPAFQIVFASRIQSRPLRLGGLGAWSLGGLVSWSLGDFVTWGLGL